MSKDFRDYFTGNNMEAKEAFLAGYVAALKRNKTYDPALFLEGHQLETHVVADLITQEKRTEEARRAQARIAADIHGGSLIITDEAREGLKEMLKACPHTAEDSPSAITNVTSK